MDGHPAEANVTSPLLSTASHTAPPSKSSDQRLRQPAEVADQPQPQPQSSSSQPCIEPSIDNNNINLNNTSTHSEPCGPPRSQSPPQSQSRLQERSLSQPIPRRSTHELVKQAEQDIQTRARDEVDTI